MLLHVRISSALESVMGIIGRGRGWLPVVEDIVRRVSIRVTATGGHPSRAFNPQVNPLKPRPRRQTKDEVTTAAHFVSPRPTFLPLQKKKKEKNSRRPVDVRLCIDLFPSIRQQRILIPDQLDAIVPLLVRLRTQRDGLRALPARVDDVDVVHLQPDGPRAQRPRQVVARRVVLRHARRDGHAVLNVARRVARGAVDGQLRAARGYVHLFRVGSWVDEDALRGRGGRGETVDRRLDRGEFLAPAASDGDAPCRW